MDLSRPFLTITPTVDGDVLYVLARADVAFTPPQVHALVGRRSEDGVRRSLVRLADQGIVHRQQVGRAVEYRLNRDHLAADPVLAIARLRETLIARLRESIGAWRLPTPFAALFGSAARGTMRPTSDIDLLVVRSVGDVDDERWTDQIHDLTTIVRGWTGNVVEVLVYEEGALRSGSRDPVIDEIRRDGITLVGSPSLLKRRSQGS